MKKKTHTRNNIETIVAQFSHWLSSSMQSFCVAHTRKQKKSEEVANEKRIYKKKKLLERCDELHESTTATGKADVNQRVIW